jgi:hypothetical protein
LHDLREAALGTDEELKATGCRSTVARMEKHERPKRKRPSEDECVYPTIDILIDVVDERDIGSVARDVVSHIRERGRDVWQISEGGFGVDLALTLAGQRAFTDEQFHGLVHDLVEWAEATDLVAEIEVIPTCAHQIARELLDADPDDVPWLEERFGLRQWVELKEMNGIHKLEAAVFLHPDEAEQLEELMRQGWELESPVKDDRGELVRSLGDALATGC